MIIDTIRSWGPGIINLGGNLLIAGLLLFIGSKVIGVLQKLFKKALTKMDMELSLSRFLLSLSHAVLYCILILTAAERVGFKSTSIVALLGSAGIAIGLSLQGSLANFAGGILILVMKPFKVGDYITCSMGEGTVMIIGLVYTTLRTVDNKRIVIPNGTLSNSPMTNVTGQETRMLSIQVGISYNADLKQGKAILENICSRHEKVLQSEPLNVFVAELADSAVILEVRCWTKTEDYFAVKWDMTEQIKLELDAAGIEIPFNQLDVHMKS